MDDLENAKLPLARPWARLTDESVRTLPCHRFSPVSYTHLDVYKRQDMDGSPRAYHPPTAASWDGKSHGGPAKDHLANAVGDPGVTKYAKSKKEKDWPLTEGCQLFRDLHKAKTLEAKVRCV